MDTNDHRHVNAAKLGLASCHRCLSVTPIEQKRCQLCHKPLFLRRPASIQKTLALLITAFLFYIPANIYPIMSTKLFGNEISMTIIGGVFLFFEEGSYFIAGIIFTASIIIPLAKMFMIIWLCYFASGKPVDNHRQLTIIYFVTEFIGKWSMIDVFVVAVLVALVQIGGIMNIETGIAASAFAMVVILTILSVEQFDIRLIWDNMDKDLLNNKQNSENNNA